MVKNAIEDLYQRFVVDMSDQLVIADDTDPGIMTTDHQESPWMCKAQNELFCDQYLEDGEKILVPFSTQGPTLLIYWLCEMPKVEIREGVGIEVVMPYGRLATLYYRDDGKIDFKSYFAK